MLVQAKIINRQFLFVVEVKPDQNPIHSRDHGGQEIRNDEDW